MRSNLRKKRGCLKNHFETPPAFNSRPQAARSAQQTVFAPIKKTRLAQKTNSQSSEAIASLRGGATERVRDDFLMQSIKKSSRTCAVRDDMVREMRLELTRLLPHAPQTCLSTYSSTLAFNFRLLGYYNHTSRVCQVFYFFLAGCSITFLLALRPDIWYNTG